jgi:hypothetical protein
MFGGRPFAASGDSGTFVWPLKRTSLSHLEYLSAVDMKRLISFAWNRFAEEKEGLGLELCIVRRLIATKVRSCSFPWVWVRV